MDEYTRKLIEEVSEGNPGALTVIRELMWFSRWEKMLKYFKDIGLTGGKLWAQCSDDYHLDFHAFGIAIDSQMVGFYRGMNTIKIKGRLPKFL